MPVASHWAQTKRPIKRDEGLEQWEFMTIQEKDLVLGRRSVTSLPITLPYLVTPYTLPSLLPSFLPSIHPYQGYIWYPRSCTLPSPSAVPSRLCYLAPTFCAILDLDRTN